MNIVLAIKYLYPNADPLKDFIVRDDGLTPTYLKAPPKQKYLYYSASQKESYGWIEGVDYVMKPVPLDELVEGVDYVMEEKGAYIEAWNLDKPQPTEVELQAAWEAYMESEANKPSELTEIEQLQADNSVMLLEISHAQARLDQSEKDQAALIFSLVEGGLL